MGVLRFIHLLGVGGRHGFDGDMAALFMDSLPKPQPRRGAVFPDIVYIDILPAYAAIQSPAGFARNGVAMAARNLGPKPHDSGLYPICAFAVESFLGDFSSFTVGIDGIRFRIIRDFDALRGNQL